MAKHRAITSTARRPLWERLDAAIAEINAWKAKVDEVDHVKTNDVAGASASLTLGNVLEILTKVQKGD